MWGRETVFFWGSGGNVDDAFISCLSDADRRQQELRLSGPRDQRWLKTGPVSPGKLILRTDSL